MEVQSNTTHTDYNYTEIPTSPSSSIPPSIPAIETESEPHDEDSIYRCDRCRPSHVIITNNVFFMEINHQVAAKKSYNITNYTSAQTDS